MIAIILLMGGIMEGIETTTLASADGSTTAAGGGGGSEPPSAETAAPPPPFLYGGDRKLTRYQMETMRDCKTFPIS
jgi:hypothetical protein